MGILRKAFDWLVIVFFATHIPITVFVDSQGLFPRDHYPQWARGMMDDFIRDYKDPLVSERTVNLRAGRRRCGGVLRVWSGVGEPRRGRAVDGR
jgi:hypothetical protein